MKKAFITGATGNIGNFLVQYLKELKVPFTAGTRHISSSEYPTQVIDFNDPMGLIKAFDGHDCLFLLTPDAPDSKNWVMNALEAAKKVGIKHIVRSSGIGANANSPYLVFNELGQMEDMVKGTGIHYTIIQPNSFFQNFATFQQAVVKQGMVFLPHIQARISYVDVRDVALAAAHVMLNPSQHQSKTYLVTGPSPITDQELLNEVGKVLNKEVKYIPVSDKDMRKAFAKYHMPDYNIELLMSLYQADRNGETAVVSHDCEKITSKASRSIRDFVRDYKQHWL